MNQEQQYRVIGKSGPGVDWRSLPGDTMIRFAGSRSDTGDKPRLLGASAPMQDWWDNARYEILEAISPPQAAVAACAGWCGLGYADPRVPAKIANSPRHTDVCPDRRGICWRDIDEGGFGKGPSYCTQACLDRAKAAKQVELCGNANGLWPPCELRRDHPGMHHCTFVDGSGGHGDWGADGGVEVKQAGATKAPECIRSACKAPPVAGGVLCAAHAGQVEAAKAGTAPAARCGHTGPLSCGKCADCTAAPVPAPAETRLERWRREHKGYSHGTADPRVHDANVAAMMVGIDGPRGPREPYVPPAPLAAWTPRDLDGDIPNAWEPGGARLGGTR